MRNVRLILDKNVVQGTKAAEMIALCQVGQALMPDILFYEMLTTSEPARSRCFAKFPGENPVILVPSVGELLRWELANRKPCGKPSTHASSMRFQFNPKLASGTYKAPEEVMAALEQARDDAVRGADELLSMIRTAPSLWPQVFDGTRDRHEARAAIERTLNDREEVVAFYGKLEAPDDIEPIPAGDLSPEWLFFRWVQVRLWAALDLALRLGPIEAELTAAQRHRIENFNHDIQYALLALLEGGLATEDDWLRRLFRLFRPDGVLAPTDSDLAAKGQRARTAVANR